MASWTFATMGYRYSLSVLILCPIGIFLILYNKRNEFYDSDNV